MDVAIGVDSHKATLEVTALDAVGKHVATKRFRNDPGGLDEILAWVRSFPVKRVVGIECSATFGAALARYLLRSGEDVREVPGNLSHAEAKLTGTGKSDPTDADAIARIVLRRPSLPPAGDGFNEDLKLLSDQRSRLVRARTAELGRIHSFMTVLRPGYQTSLGALKHDKTLSLVIRMVRADNSVRAQLVRDSVAEVRRLNRAIARVEQRIEGPLASSGTTLHRGLGIGTTAAAKILGEVGDPAQLRSAAGFARMSGVAPIPASSGNTVRHRHDRGGNRVLNHAIHMIALTRCRLDQTTKEFMAKKRAEGKTGREALRALKRHIANDIYRHMKADCRSPAELTLTT
jgi:transposase